jgi:hypothetical protein
MVVANPLPLEALMLVRTRLLPALAVACIACDRDRQASGATADSTSHRAAAPAGADRAGGNIVTVTATDYAFNAPAEVPAGVTTIKLVNKGPSLHHIQLLRFEGDKTLDDFLGEMKKGEGSFPAWAREAGGPAPPEVGSTSVSIESLEPGNYALVCFVPAADGMPHVMKGMSRPLKVVAASSAAAPEPEADLVAKLVDYDFELSRPLTAGKHLIRVENAGPQPHEIVIVRLSPGKKPADYAAWGMKPVGPPPGTIHGGLSGIMPGAHSFIEVDLPEGEYGLLCFIPDAKDGKPHFEHGMAKTTRVSS